MAKYQQATYNDAWIIGGSIPPHPSASISGKLIERSQIGSVNCQIKDNPILQYSDNQCVLKDDLETYSPYHLVTKTYSITGKIDGKYVVDDYDPTGNGFFSDVLDIEFSSIQLPENIYVDREHAITVTLGSGYFKAKAKYLGYNDNILYPIDVISDVDTEFYTVLSVSNLYVSIIFSSDITESQDLITFYRNYGITEDSHMENPDEYSLYHLQTIDTQKTPSQFTGSTVTFYHMPYDKKVNVGIRRYTFSTVCKNTKRTPSKMTGIEITNSPILTVKYYVNDNV